MSLTVPYILSQILVIVYYLIYSYTFHLKDSNKILILGIIATIISSLSYMLLSAYTGMIMCFIAIIRNLLFKKDKESTSALIIIIILTIIGSIFTFDSYFSLFNVIATLIYTYALWQKDSKIYKLLGVIVNGLMTIYNIYIKSILGVILISIAFISSILGYSKENNNHGGGKINFKLF